MGKSKGQMKSRLSYSAGAFGNDVFYATLSTYFIMFVTTHLFNTGDPKQNSHYVLLITNIIAILRILEVFIDPLIGNMIITLILSMVIQTMGSWWWYHQFYRLVASLHRFRWFE